MQGFIIEKVEESNHKEVRDQSFNHESIENASILIHKNAQGLEINQKRRDKKGIDNWENFILHSSSIHKKEGHLNI